MPAYAFGPRSFGHGPVTATVLTPTLETPSGVTGLTVTAEGAVSFSAPTGTYLLKLRPTEPNNTDVYTHQVTVQAPADPIVTEADLAELGISALPAGAYVLWSRTIS